MAPQFRYLMSPTPPPLTSIERKPLIAEVLRCHAYFDETVFANVRHILTASESGSRAEGTLLEKMRYIAVVFHSMIGNDEKRAELRELAEQAVRCKVPMLKKEQELFFQSMSPSESVPEFKKCLHKSDLVFCYFRRELQSGNWNGVKKLLTDYPIDADIRANIDLFLTVADQNSVESTEIMGLLMENFRVNNPYFVELADYDKILKKVAEFCSADVSECKFDKTEGLVSKWGRTLKVEKTYVSKKNLNLLKQRIDAYVKGTKQGLVKTKEYELVSNWVDEWKRKRKLTDGKDVVVVDALNFGGGRDPRNWACISKQFTHVVFATRFPPATVREEVLKRYKGNAVFCDKQSADDLIILRMGLEFGPETCLVTNDRYRDHQLAICGSDPKMKKIWNDFMADAVYKHEHEKIEPRRDYNLRIINQEDVWFVPVLNDDSESQALRDATVYCVEINHSK